MIAQTPKLKKSKTPYDYISQTVYVFHDRCDGKVVLSFSPEWTDCFIADRDNIKIQAKQLTPIKSKPKVLTVEERGDKDDLNAFFDEVAKTMRAHCDECTAKLFAFNAFAKRSCIAHILPKKKFPSVATNPNNVLFLGAAFLGGCSCHDEFDKMDIDHRKSMKVYPYAIEQFATHLRYELNDEHLISACKYLGIDYKNYEV